MSEKVNPLDPTTKLDIAKMKQFYRSQAELSKLRTELAELEARYVKAKVEHNHYSGLLAQQEANAQVKESEEKAPNPENGEEVPADLKDLASVEQ